MLSNIAVYSVEWCDGFTSTWTAFDPIIAIKRAIKERNFEHEGTDNVRWHARHIERIVLVAVLDKPSPRRPSAGSTPEDTSHA